jgi:hypothetical protein
MIRHASEPQEEWSCEEQNELKQILLEYTPTQNDCQYKKQGPSPIFLVRATRIFSKAKTLKKRSVIAHWR